MKTGEKYNRLTVLKTIPGCYTKCRCDCGNVVRVRNDNLVSGSTKSCGCYARDLADAQRKPPPSKPTKAPTRKMKRDEARMRGVWSAMMQRCYNPNNAAYKYYGARGIAVSLDWHNQDVFMYEMAWLYRPGLWLERDDNNAPYEADNCSFRTPKAQAKNRSNSLLLTGAAGRQTNLSQWAEHNGVAYQTAYRNYCKLKLDGEVQGPDLLKLCLTNKKTV